VLHKTKSKVLENLAMHAQVVRLELSSHQTDLEEDLAKFKLSDKIVDVIHTGTEVLASNAV